MYNNKTVGDAPFYRPLPGEYTSRIVQTPTEYQRQKRLTATIFIAASSIGYSAYLIYKKIKNIKTTGKLEIGLQLAVVLSTAYSLYLYATKKA